MKARLRAIAISSAALWAGATISAQGQSFSVLHTFARGNFKDINTFTNADGVNPSGGLVSGGGRLYGVAITGGTNGTGTIFALNPDGTGFTVLHQFDALDTASQTNTEGAFPSAGLLLTGGTLYGTAYNGGIYGQGTVFSLNTNGTGFTNFYNFAAGSDDGAYPAGRLLLVGPLLYGTTYYGGNPDNGVVFALNTNGSGGISILKSFPPADPSNINTDGANPSAGLILSGTTLYGTTVNGGMNGDGVAFAINTNVSGSGFSVLHHFDANSQYPSSELVVSGPTLYGMSGSNLFALNTDGTGFAVVRQFSDAVGVTSSGASPGLSLFGNTLYAAADGVSSLRYGQVFSMNTDGSNFTDYHDFTSPASADGAFPNGGLPLINGAVYGTTAGGGLNANGVVFKAAALVSVAGTVAYYPTTYPSSALSTIRVGNVTMSVTGGANLSALTLADGSYSLSGIAVGGTYSFTPSKTDDSPTRNGVTSFDQALIQAHILKLRFLDSPYKLLAADVSGDGAINSFDQAYIQAFILGKINLFPAGLWRFVPADYLFPDPANPWAAPANRWYTNLVATVTNGDFVGIKLGEVANLWTAPSGGQSLMVKSVGGSQALGKDVVPGAVFAVSQQSAQPGQTVSVGVTVSGFHQVTSAQFSLAWDPAVLRYVGTGNYGLKGVAAECFGATLTGSGKLAFAWYDSEGVGVTLADGTGLFTVSFEVIGKAGSVSALALADSPTAQQVSMDFTLAAFGALDGSIAVAGPGVLAGNSVYANGVFRLSVPTENGHSYSLEFTDSLGRGNWTALPAVAGDGTVIVLMDSAATNQQRFYRVHVQ